MICDMKLYHFPVAPNPARVLFYLKEKQLTQVELVLVDFFKGEQSTPAHLARSPRGTVPVLENDEGDFLTECLPIIEYLEELYPTPPLIGVNALQRQCVRARERYIELNIFAPLARIVHCTNSPLGWPANPAVVEYEMRNLPGAMTYVDELVGEGPFVMGSQVTIADCTLLAGFNFAKFGGLEIVEEYANLTRWFDRFALRHL